MTDDDFASEPHSGTVYLTVDRVDPDSVYEESAIVEPLRANYPVFRRFYDSTRPHIPGVIIWIHDPNVLAGGEAQGYKVDGQVIYRAIKIPCIPVTVEDALTIAHELQHHRLNTEGYPSIIYNNNNENGHLPNSIQSMVEDLLVHPALIEAGFDVQASMEAEWTRARDELEAIEAPPPNAATALIWVVNFASHVLDYRWLTQYRSDYPEPAFFAWIDYTYPALMTEARELAHLVMAFGYDQPVRMGALLNIILQRYGLTDAYRIN